MTDRIDQAIAASLERILRNWTPRDENDPKYDIFRLEDSILEEVEWLRLS